MGVREQGAAPQGKSGCGHGQGRALPHQTGGSPTEPEQSHGEDSARAGDHHAR